MSSVGVFSRISPKSLLSQVNKILVAPMEIFTYEHLNFCFGDFYSCEVTGHYMSQRRDLSRLITTNQQGVQVVI